MIINETKSKKTAMIGSSDKINKLLFEKNVFLYGDITDSVVKEVVETINEHIEKLYEQMYKFSMSLPNKIALHINSSGGELSSGFALMDYIQNCPIEIVTIAEGKVMSMAFPVYLAANERYAGNFAVFQYHEASSYSYGKLSDIKKELEDSENMDRLIDDFICERTNITQDQLTDIVERKTDWLINKEEAIELGIVTNNI